MSEISKGKVTNLKILGIFFKKSKSSSLPSLFGFLLEWAIAEKRTGRLRMLYGEVSGVLYKIASGISRSYVKTYNVKFSGMIKKKPCRILKGLGFRH